MTVELTEGMLLGRYRLLRRLAEGGMGTVWVARDERLQREVAIKVLPQIMVSDDAVRKRFEREARAMARVLHPNVVPIFDMGTADPSTGEELPFIVMELVEGTSLDRLLAAEGKLDADRAMAIAEQVARALGAAHGAGIIHRDLKPSNIMVTRGGGVKVLDFGLARLMQQDECPEATLTQPGMVLGSCPYMSPEQALGEPLGPPSDIFACGAVLFEMVSGRRAFTGATPVEVLRRVAAAEMEPLERAAPDTPPELAAILERCLERAPARRYPDGAALAEDLAAARQRLTKVEDSAKTRITRSRVGAMVIRRRRQAALFLTVAVLALVLGGALGFLVERMLSREFRSDAGGWRVARLLGTRGSLRHPSWGPKGQLVVVERHQGSATQLVLVEAKGGKERVIARGRGGEILAWPVISPDGAAVAAVAIDEGEYRLVVFPIVGGRPELVAMNAAHPVWLGARRLAFSRPEEGKGRLWEVDLESREERRLETGLGDRSVWGLIPGPRGRMAAVIGPDDVHAGIMVSSGLKPGASWSLWMEPKGPQLGASWSASGRSLVVSNDGMLERLTQGRLTPVLPMTDRLLDPAVSPVGDSMAVVRSRKLTELVSVDPGGGPPVCLICGLSGAGWGSVGPDGRVVFRIARGDRKVLYLRDRHGEERVLLNSGEQGSCPVFSPDGTRVAFLAPGVGGAQELRVAPVEGGASVLLAEGVEPSEYPSWSSDGRFLAFASGTPPAVWTVATAGGTPKRLTPGPGDYPQWSPDGRWIAYVVWTDASDPEQGAWVVPAGGGRAKQLSRFPTQLAWRPDGGVLWQVRRKGENLELWEAPAGSWEWRRVGPLDLGGPAAPHVEHMPMTVDRSTGRLVINRRSSTAQLLVFRGIDPRRW
ncbi:MAG: protein kinase [Acidobacteria bacterium]|nr:protein kinase [Acidobacteriota bacterium]